MARRPTRVDTVLGSHIRRWQSRREADADELVAILRAARGSNEVAVGPAEYVIPNRRPASVRRSERSPKVIWETVRCVAGRAKVRSHAHALRAAFAVRFDEAHPDQLLALKDLLGHARLETALVYLRRRKKQLAMERVRDLSWGSVGGFVFTAECSRGAYGIRTRATTECWWQAGLR
jgi:integrase